MRSAYTWIIAGTAGALVGATTTYYAVDNQQSAAPLATANQVQPPREQKMDSPVTFANHQLAQDLTAGRRENQPVSGTKIESPSPTGSADKTEKKKPDPVKEEAMVQDVLARLYDPTMTLPGIMQSEEMLKLSDESRQRVVAKMVYMLNHGEIDARTFMPAGK